VWGSAFPATVIRFGGIYGPSRTRLIDSLRAGSATCVAQPPLYTNRIHRDDCAAALAHLMTLAEPESLYLGVDDDPAPQCQVLGWLAARLGVAGPRVVAEQAAARGQRANKRCRNTRLRASGFRFRYPSYRDGYRAMLAER
jgi:nucleoside-diphosphate-sugar epimerase